MYRSLAVTALISSAFLILRSRWAVLLSDANVDLLSASMRWRRSELRVTKLFFVMCRTSRFADRSSCEQCR